MLIQFKIKDNHKDYKKVRQQVFVEEQGFEHEFDMKDYQAMHLTMYVDGELIGTCRGLINDNIGTIGRLAILPEYRRKGFGAKMLDKMEEMLRSYNVKVMELKAQIYAVPFYEQKGYHRTGIEEMDEKILHIWMRKEVTDAK